MNPADPNPKLTPEEKAFAEVLRSRVRPAAAPEDFAERLRKNGPPAASTGKIVPMRAEKPRRVSLAVAAAAAAAVALAWIGLHFIRSDLRQPSIAGETPLLDAGNKKDDSTAPNPLPGGTASATGAGDHVAAEQLLAVREVAVIRRDYGLPPVQLLSVQGMRVTREGTGRKLEVETHFVPVALEYH